MDTNTGVLLLNATFEPLRVVPVWRAVWLLVDEKAVVVNEAANRAPIRSQHLEIPFPSVIRLVNYVHVPYKTRTRLNTRTVLSRDDMECCYCGNRADTMDHIHPTSRGGQHVWTNVVAACSRCNSKKSDHLLEELGWKMRYQPTIPPDQYWLVVGKAERTVWNQYIPALATAAA